MGAFLRWPDPRLGVPAARVGAVDADVEAHWQRLVGLIVATPGIVGLAAPQIGEGRAVAVVDCSAARDAPVRLADPEILWASQETRLHREGSPNLPGAWAEVARPAAVRVAFLDASGERVERDFEGLWATSVQHQIDHLEGRMFFDRLSRLKRERLLKAAAKRGRSGGGSIARRPASGRSGP